MKLGRKCQLKVEVDPQRRGDLIEGSSTLTIPRNATVEFEITRQFWGNSQEATFRVLNLAERTRNLIAKDPFALTEYRAIQFWAGYEDFPLPLCFNGFVRSATSYRRGQDMVTEISAYDGGMAMVNGWTAQTLAQGTTVRDALLSLAKALPRLAGSPIVGDFPGSNLRGKVLFGNTWSLILQESGNLATIDNGQVKVLQPDEAIDAGIPLIDASTGLLGSPRRTPNKLEFAMLFEPRLTVGQFVELQSTTNRLYNGAYKVTGFNHRGAAPSTGPDATASVIPVVNGDCTSTVSLFFGLGEFQLVEAAVVQ